MRDQFVEIGSNYLNQSSENIRHNVSNRLSWKHESNLSCSIFFFYFFLEVKGRVFGSFRHLLKWSSIMYDVDDYNEEIVFN